MKLYIGNKNYSSWSFRPWIGLRHAGIPFEEVQLWFDHDHGHPEIRAMSPSGKVPVLADGDLVLPESLAILDHVARKLPETGLWPADPLWRSRAMAMACEMATGFSALRAACPMNMRRTPAPIKTGAEVAGDVARIKTLWGKALADSGGPFLCGSFSIADAMFAPVVNRFVVYAFETDAVTRAYMDRMKALPAWQEWEQAGFAEDAVVAEEEV
ncbi:glutathione S-transferase family protein [Pseudohoeflea coraliihabitans]|uniref:Glutathione S-transferase family protein n=1 Tax=Pseudohoeflea coraliihabitans TaxID=2860393 RepID=A0ABS6WLQ5_9HYPH|nr:glutathione S-transferase family protein [Pseudohoeflea sp. DP4N28-3]MBW3096588.1 glutathione S-transferase family protein [Pseudohoeflea sp. DP4N28-3]